MNNKKYYKDIFDKYLTDKNRQEIIITNSFISKTLSGNVIYFAVEKKRNSVINLLGYTYVIIDNDDNVINSESDTELTVSAIRKKYNQVINKN